MRMMFHLLDIQINTTHLYLLVSVGTKSFYFLNIKCITWVVWSSEYVSLGSVNNTLELFEVRNLFIANIVYS